MATTSYSTGGAPVGAATTNPVADADSVSRAATGAGAAQTPQERTFDAANAAPSSGNGVSTANERRPRRWRCRWIVGGAIVLLVLVAVSGRGGGG